MHARGLSLLYSLRYGTIPISQSPLKKVMGTVMHQDFSWHHSAAKRLKLYEQAARVNK